MSTNTSRNPSGLALPGIFLLALLAANANFSLSVTFAQDEADTPAEQAETSQADTEEVVVEATATAGSEASDSSAEIESESDLLDALETSDDQAEGTRSASSASGETIELSVEPGSLPLLPADRPAWVGADPDYSSEVHRLYVGSAAVAERSDVDSALDVPLIAALNGYLDDQVLNRTGASDSLGLDDAFVRRNLIADTDGVVLQLNTGGEPMYQKWVVLEVTPTQREQFLQWYRESEQRERIKPVAVGLAGILALVALTHVLLRGKQQSPTAQPLAADAMSNKDAQANARSKRKSGVWGKLLAVGGILFVLAMVSLPAWTVVRHKKHIKHEDFLREVESPSVVVDFAAADSNQATVQINDQEQEFIIKANGQEVIQRVQRVR